MEQKIYNIRGETKSYQEAKAFIEWYRNSVRRSFDRHMIMLKHIPQRVSVLDYGCGWGILSEMIHEEKKCHVDGIDIDTYSIQVARDFVKERDGLSFSTKSIREIDDEVYDVVVSAEVIEHTFNPGMYLKECCRVLKPGGYLIISLPNIITPRHIFSTFWGSSRRHFGAISQAMKDSYNKVHHHIQAWDPVTFCRLACVMGFDYVDHEFMEGWALPKNRYWRHPWGKLRNLSCKVMFKLGKHRYVDVQPYE